MSISLVLHLSLYLLVLVPPSSGCLALSSASSSSSIPLLNQMLQVLFFTLAHLLSLFLLFLYFYTCSNSYSCPFPCMMIYVSAPALFFAFISFFSLFFFTTFSLGTPTSCSTSFRYSCDGQTNFVYGLSWLMEVKMEKDFDGDIYTRGSFMSK